jgi:hypothetical protein
VPLRDKQCPFGTTARLSCRVVSKSRFTAKWYKDGQPIRSGGRFDVQSDFASQTLIIRDCRVEDSGEYKCEAKNLDGVSSTVAMLTVQGMWNVKSLLKARFPLCHFVWRRQNISPMTYFCC